MVSDDTARVRSSLSQHGEDESLGSSVGVGAWVSVGSICVCVCVCVCVFLKGRIEKSKNFIFCQFYSVLTISTSNIHKELDKRMKVCISMSKEHCRVTAWDMDVGSKYPA